MAKQPKPDDTVKDTPPNTDAGPNTGTGPNTGAAPANEAGSASETGQTLTVNAPPEGGAAMSETVHAAVSETISAALDAGKSPKDQIVVLGPKGGRWRAGRHFGPEPTIIDVNDLTEEEGRALIDDPKLVVGPAFPALPS